MMQQAMEAGEGAQVLSNQHQQQARLLMPTQQQQQQRRRLAMAAAAAAAAVVVTTAAAVAATQTMMGTCLKRLSRSFESFFVEDVCDVLVSWG